MVSLKLTFDGYWREPNKSGVPKTSGIYCVYECTFNESSKSVTLHRIIYIGESDNVGLRISGHERLNNWIETAANNNRIICYSFASVDNTPDRKIAEAALIFKHKPVLNSEYIDQFPFNSTNLILSGKTTLLNTNFTV